MMRLPERALVIKKRSLLRMDKDRAEVASLLAFDRPYAESETVIIYGPYFDFESLEEVCHRLDQLGLEYWDDYIDLKEDIPDWFSLGVFPTHSAAGSSGS